MDSDDLTIRGQRRDIGLGSVTLVSLAEARITALKNRKIALVDREDPRAGSRKGLTFREAAERTHKANQARWRSARSRETWMASLDRHAFPTLGDMEVACHWSARRIARPGAGMGKPQGNRPQGPPKGPPGLVVVSVTWPNHHERGGQ